VNRAGSDVTGAERTADRHLGLQTRPRFSNCTTFGFAMVVGVPLPTASSTSALLPAAYKQRAQAASATSSLAMNRSA
jgi:hypothetical protein